MKSFSLIAVTLCLSFLLPVRPAAAQSLFYEGEVIVESISTKITLSDQAVVETEYVLLNQGDQEEQISVQLADPAAREHLVYFFVSDPLTIQPKERKILLSKYTLPLPEGDFPSFTYHLALEFDGKPLAHSTNQIETEIILPEGVHQIIGSNKTFTDPEVDEQGRSHLFREVWNQFPTQTSLKWSRLGIQLQVEKSIQPQKIMEPNQTLEVHLEVVNTGDAPLESITLRDDFSPSMFEGVSPEEEFTLTDPNESDPRLVWEVEVPSLESGEKKIFEYTLRYQGDVSQIYDFDVESTVVLWNGRAVALSNPVRMAKLAGAQEVKPRGHFLYSDAFQWILYSAAGLLLVAAVIIAVVVVKRLRRSS
ncbi:MAG: hypothetical protein R6U51_08075 [Anaerolineales bacterium]